MMGLRPGELLGLKWTDWDQKKNVLHVQRSVKIVDGALVLGDLKTDRSDRYLAVPAPVVVALKRHKVKQAGERELATYIKLWDSHWTELGLMFPTATGNITDPHNFRRTFRRLIEAAEIPGSWTTNELRHSCISLLYEAGTPIERISDQVGHVDTRMIERVYRHSLAPVLAAVGPMEEMFGKKVSRSRSRSPKRKKAGQRV